MTTSRIVMPRGRVSMNITTFATSLASSRLPDSLAGAFGGATLAEDLAGWLQPLGLRPGTAGTVGVAVLLLAIGRCSAGCRRSGLAAYRPAAHILSPFT
jgi:hypothetical protein